MAHMTVEQLVSRIDAASAGADPLRRVTLAAMAADELADVADDLVDHYVTAARGAGASWADIGSAMGVTKQAAQQRHATRPTPVDELEGLDDDARAAWERARAEARSMQHDFVGTEHVLVGVLRTRPDLARALEVEPDDAVATTLALVGRGDHVPLRPAPLTKRTTKVLDLAAAGATARGHDLVSPTDLLRAVVAEGRGIGARVLDQRGGGLAAVRSVLDGLD